MSSQTVIELLVATLDNEIDDTEKKGSWRTQFQFIDANNLTEQTIELQAIKDFLSQAKTKEGKYLYGGKEIVSVISIEFLLDEER